MISGEFTINELTTTGNTAAKPTQGKKTAAARIAALKAAYPEIEWVKVAHTA